MSKMYEYAGAKKRHAHTNLMFFRHGHSSRFTIGWWSRSGSNRRPQACKARALPTELRPRDDDSASQVVGPGRVERPTSRLSGVRSNHLSYEPESRYPHTRDQDVSGSLRQTKSRFPGAPARAFACKRIAGLSTENKEGKRRRRQEAPLCLGEMSRRDVSVAPKTSSLERR